MVPAPVKAIESTLLDSTCTPEGRSDQAFANVMVLVPVVELTASARLGVASTLRHDGLC